MQLPIARQRCDVFGRALNLLHRILEHLLTFILRHYHRRRYLARRHIRDQLCPPASVLLVLPLCSNLYYVPQHNQSGQVETGSCADADRDCRLCKFRTHMHHKDIC